MDSTVEKWKTASIHQYVCCHSLTHMHSVTFRTISGIYLRDHQHFSLRSPTKSLDADAWWHSTPSNDRSDVFRQSSEKYRTDPQIMELFEAARGEAQPYACKTQLNFAGVSSILVSCCSWKRILLDWYDLGQTRSCYVVSRPQLVMALSQTYVNSAYSQLWSFELQISLEFVRSTAFSIMWCVAQE